MKFAQLILMALGTSAFPAQHKCGCPPINQGTFVIDQYQLYPENADWDAHSCVVYFGVLFNASVAVYDPYKAKVVETLEFPNITRSGTEHIGGVAWDQHSGLITILVDAAAPFETNGANIAGDNIVIKYDPRKKTVLWTQNITAVTQGTYGGFQDVEHDARGNTYVVGTWPSSIMRIDKEGKAAVPWYLPQTAVSTKQGLSGLAAVGDVLLANDGDGQIYRFDMRDEHGKPTRVSMTPNITYTDEDAIYLPPKYKGTVLLVSSHAAGIQVLRSKDAKWKTAENLGTIANFNGTLYEGSMTTAAVQIGSNSVYMINEYFLDPLVAGQVAGNRSLFPMPDITAMVDNLLK